MSRVLRFGLLFLICAATVLVAVPAQAGGGCHSDTFSDIETDRVVTRGACFVPTVARVAVGSTVSWSAVDGIDHTVTGVSGAFGAQRNDALTATEPLDVTFSKPGVYPYVCALHPMMAGAIVVGDIAPIAADAPDVSSAAPATSTSAAVQTGGFNAAGAGLAAAAALIVLLVAGPRVLHTLRRD